MVGQLAGYDPLHEPVAGLGIRRTAGNGSAGCRRTIFRRTALRFATLDLCVAHRHTDLGTAARDVRVYYWYRLQYSVGTNPPRRDFRIVVKKLRISATNRVVN